MYISPTLVLDDLNTRKLKKVCYSDVFFIQMFVIQIPLYLEKPLTNNFQRLYLKSCGGRLPNELNPISSAAISSAASADLEFSPSGECMVQLKEKKITYKQIWAYFRIHTLPTFICVFMRMRKYKYVHVFYIFQKCVYKCAYVFYFFGVQ